MGVIEVGDDRLMEVGLLIIQQNVIMLCVTLGVCVYICMYM